MSFIAIFIIAFGVAAVLSPIVAKAAVKVGAVDAPDGERKLHDRPVPLMGGLAVAGGLIAAAGLALWFGWLPGAHIHGKYVAGIFAALTFLTVGGALDDRLRLRPLRQIVWPLLAIAAVIASGIGVGIITNPFGGVLHLDRIVETVFWWNGIPYRITLLADLFTVAWLLGMTYTTKFLDGLDGLVAGVTVIGAFVIAAVSMMRNVSQPDTALLALAVAGAFAGFLLFNFHPARVFLGEGGSTAAGFLLGTLAIISGGKIATTLLVLALPLFDAALVIVRRVLSGRSPTKGDRSHLHFRLLDMGFTHRQAVLFFYFIAAFFGVSTLVLRGPQKVVALLAVAPSVLLLVLAIGLIMYRRRSHRS